MTLPKKTTEAAPRSFARQHPQIGGAGIGMYLVQHVIASRGGYLAVKSEVDTSTTFAIYWEGN